MSLVRKFRSYFGCVGHEYLNVEMVLSFKFYQIFLGEPIDERGPINTDKFAAIHAEAPEFVDMSVEQEILVTGIKVVDLLAPYAKGGKIGKQILLFLCKI